jgi:hypothetical protein
MILIYLFSGFSLNGTHLGLAKLHVTHSKDKKGTTSGTIDEPYDSK